MSEQVTWVVKMCLVTDSYHMGQFAGILGFLFTNSYLAFKKFKHGEEKTNHVNFKVKLATTLCKFQPHAPLQLRSSFLGDNAEDLTVASHKLVKLDHPLRCHYCTTVTKKREPTALHSSVVTVNATSRFASQH